jgi:hypothetical protein
VEAANRFANTCSIHMAVAANYVLTGSEQHSDSAPRDGRATVRPLTRDEKEGKA